MTKQATYVDSDGYKQPLHPQHVWNRSRLYVIRAVGTNLVKVGVSGDVERRLRQLQAGSPVELRVEERIVGTRTTEAHAHRLLKQHGFHRHGEWFELTSDQVKWLLTELWCDGMVPA